MLIGYGTAGRCAKREQESRKPLPDKNDSLRAVNRTRLLTVTILKVSAK